MSERYRALSAALAAACGRQVASEPESRPGGTFEACYRWPTEGAPLFVKLGAAAAEARLAAEAEGLAALAASGAVRVPAVIGLGRCGDEAFLALEWLELVRPDLFGGEPALGRALAALHAVHSPRFGFPADNFIGLTPQANGWLADGAEFLIERRLKPQLALARRLHPRLVAKGERLLDHVPAFYGEHPPAASLLHGDLWFANCAMLADGTPVVFDPAPYFGDAEADIAMTRMFRGFGARFYASYAEHHPPRPGAEAREGLHRLYHSLNHLNLFGFSYLGDTERLLDALLERAGG